MTGGARLTLSLSLFAALPLGRGGVVGDPYAPYVCVTTREGRGAARKGDDA